MTTSLVTSYINKSSVGEALIAAATSATGALLSVPTSKIIPESTNRIVNNMWNGVMTLNLSTITETNGSIARGLTRADIYNSRENNFNPAAKLSRPSPRINPTGGGLKSNRKMYY